MPQEVTLPDGRILVIPDNITLDQRAALRNKIGAKYADIKTGMGMEQRAGQQVRGTLASRIQPVPSPGLYGPAPGEVPPGPGPVVPGQMASPVRGAEEHELAVGAPVGAAGAAALGAMSSPAVRTGVGMVAGGKLAQAFKIPTWIGATLGGAVGGGGFPGRITRRMGATEEPPIQMEESAPGTFTRVPIRPTPTSPLTPEQVPGGDLSQLATRGDPRAAQEMVRRGQRVIYTSPEEYPGTRLQGTLSERIGGQTPATQQRLTLSERTAQQAPTVEDAMEQARRGAPGISPVIKSVRRHYAKVSDKE